MREPRRNNLDVGLNDDDDTTMSQRVHQPLAGLVISPPLPAMRAVIDLTRLPHSWNFSRNIAALQLC